MVLERRPCPTAKGTFVYSYLPLFLVSPFIICICKSHLLPVLLLAQVGKVVVAKKTVGNAALANPLLAKHHKPDVHSQLFEIRKFKDF